MLSIYVRELLQSSLYIFYRYVLFACINMCIYVYELIFMISTYKVNKIEEVIHTHDGNKNHSRCIGGVDIFLLHHMHIFYAAVFHCSFFLFNKIYNRAVAIHLEERWKHDIFILYSYIFCKDTAPFLVSFQYFICGEFKFSLVGLQSTFALVLVLKPKI